MKIEQTPRTRSLRLGAFDLHRKVGRGGMAYVWEATHRATQTPVAVKVLHGITSQAPGVRSAFRNEIRAVARLEHPGIVRVYDFGEVGVEDSVSSDDELLPRSPYLVMSYMAGGSLAPLCGRLAWWEVRQVLLYLLDALAHSHARGLIHRDIKPENVLLSARRAQVKLSDYGIVHVTDGVVHGLKEGYLLGTPAFMAPEQFRRAVRDYGPWTDIYALGCLAWTLLSGKPPFVSARTRGELEEMHRREPLPELESHCVVPAVLWDWLQCMLAKDPGDRFQRAAEAARALQSMPSRWRPGASPADWMGGVEEDDVPTDPSMAVVGGLSLNEDQLGLTTIQRGEEDLLASMGSGSFLPAAEGHPTLDAAPMPQTWEGPSDAESAEADPLMGTGLGLFWLRAIPVIGRTRERDSMWEVLRAVQNFGRASAIVLQGEAGCGKSRLARWLCERSHEIGGAATMRATHSPGGGASEGLADMLARFFGMRGLDRMQALARMEALLSRQGVEDAEEARALVDLMGGSGLPAGDSEGDGSRSMGGRERHLLLYRTLVRLGRDRPLVLWLDDVHFSLDSLDFVRHVLGCQDRDPAPVLFVMTARAEALTLLPAEAGLLDEIVAQPDAYSLEVGPLEARERQRMVRRLLQLEPGLARQIEQRTAGNPLFAVQLVGDWVDRGLLEPGPDGFRLREGADVPIPDSVHTVWLQRVEQLLAARPGGDGLALELAASLGLDIDHHEWLDVCRSARVTPGEDLIEELLDATLAACGPSGPEDGWSFSHGMLRESLERRAEDAGRGAEHHLHCARWLRGQLGPKPNERIAAHLLRAVRVEEALPPLRDAIAARLDAGELRQGAALLAQYERCVDEAKLPSVDLRRGFGSLLQVRLAGLRGDDVAFDLYAERARESAPRGGGARLLMALGYEEAYRFRRRGQLEEARVALMTVRAEADSVHDNRLLGLCVATQAHVAEAMGKRSEAEALHREALLLSEKVQDPLAAGRTLVAMAGLAARSGDLEGSEQLLTLARGYFGRVGARAGEAAIHVVRGLACRLRGDFAKAEAHYREAVQRYEALGGPQSSGVKMALAQVLALREQFAESEALLLDCLAWFDERGDVADAGRVHLSLLPSLAFKGDWTRWDGHMKAGWQILVHTGLVDEELASCARFAGDMAAGRDEMHRARHAWDLARRLFERAGRVPDADGVHKSLPGVRVLKRTETS